MNITEYLFEAVVALFVGGFAWGFQSWAKTLKESTQRIIDELRAMALEVHDHRVESVEHLARLDERVKSLESNKG